MSDLRWPEPSAGRSSTLRLIVPPSYPDKKLDGCSRTGARQLEQPGPTVTRTTPLVGLLLAQPPPPASCPPPPAPAAAPAPRPTAPITETDLLLFMLLVQASSLLRLGPPPCCVSLTVCGAALLAYAAGHGMR